jgi:peptidyl-prolyl cis-trans isomerase C
MIRVNDVAIDDTAIAAEAAHHTQAPEPVAAAAQELALRALLLQEAKRLDLEPPASSQSSEEAADDALIARLLAEQVITPTPTDAECRRYYAAHPERFRAGELIAASHILFAVTPGTPLTALRKRAEQLLLELVAHPDRFARYAAEYSNCPSAGVGGNLGQLQRGESAPEFEKAVFAGDRLGILPQLINTRFGFHIVRVDARVPGAPLPYEAVQARIAAYLSERVRRTATQQYLRILAGRADIEGIELAAAAVPLLQ